MERAECFRMDVWKAEPRCQSTRWGIRLVICGLVWSLVGCTPSANKAPLAEQVRDAIGAVLPPFLSVADTETESLATGPDEVKVNVKAAIAPKEDLFVVDRKVNGDPSLLLIKTAQTIGSKTTIYGFVLARRTVGSLDVR